MQIDGFTDSVGTDSYNDSLSKRRADSVKSALMTRGIDSSRIGTEGYGKGVPGGQQQRFGRAGSSIAASKW